MGATPACPIPSDPSYPGGCPAGFALQESYYVPNSEVINATASTPGAIPIPGGPNGCPSYSCVNAQKQSPYGALDAQCEAQNKIPPQMIISGIAAAAVLFLLPGMLKILAIPIAGFGLVTSFGLISQGQADGTCKWVSPGL